MSDDDKLVNDAVAELVGKDAVFTAFDVSKEAKNKGSTTRHRDLKSKIHGAVKAFVDAGTYEVTKLQKGEGAGAGAPADVLVYHPPGDDPKEYEFEDMI